jgi:hypothetical protein
MKAPAMDSEKPIEPDIAELILRLEERLLLPEVRRSARRVGALLAEEFRENRKLRPDLRQAADH